MPVSGADGWPFTALSSPKAASDEGWPRMNAPSRTEPSQQSPSPRPPLRHHYSRATAVSLELPASWTQVKDGNGGSTYAETTDMAVGSSSELPPAQLAIQSFILSAGQLGGPEALLRRVMADAGVPAGEAELRTLLVDQQPAHLLVQTRPDSTGRGLLHFQVFVQLDRVLYSITGKGPVERAAELRPLFEAATQSIRFIPVSRGT